MKFRKINLDSFGMFDVCEVISRIDFPNALLVEVWLYHRIACLGCQRPPYTCTNFDATVISFHIWSGRLFEKRVFKIRKILD